MDPSDETRLREIQRQYLDFLDDDVNRKSFFNIHLKWFLTCFGV